MAENTNVGSIQMDFKVNQKSIDLEMARVSNYVSNGFKNMFNGMASQTGSFMKKSIGDMTRGFKGFTQSGTQSSDKVSQSVSRMNTQYEKTEEQIKSIQKELSKLFAEQDDIARNFQDFPAFSGMTKEETMDHMLKSNPRYNELAEQIEKLTAKMEPLIEKNKVLGEEIKNAGDNAQETGSKISFMGRSTKNAGENADRASKKTRLFGDEMKKSGVKSAGFAAMINRSFRSILRRLFVYNLILKGVRGLMSHMGAALKTNREFVNSLNIIKTNLLVAFQPIYSFILPALNALMKAIATVTTYIASAISALFGKSYQQSFGAAKGLENAKKGMAGYGKAAKRAGKEAKGALAGFDEINQLDIKDDSGSDSGGGGGGGAGGFEMTMPDTSTIDLSGIEKFKEIISSIFEPFKLAWEKEGQATIDAMKNAFKSILELSKSIGRSWLEVWTNGTGQRMLENILRIIQNIFNIVGNLATAFKNAWEKNKVGTRIIQGMFDIFNIILETIEKITKSTAEWAKTLDFSPLLESISKLLEALKPLTQNIGDGLAWLWENALLPLAGWVIEDALPSFLNMLSGAIGVLNAVIEILKPLGSWLWEKFLKPLAKWTGGAIVDILDGIALGFEKITEWLEELKVILSDSDSFWEAMFKIGVHIVKGLFEGIVSVVVGVGSWIKENLIDPIVNSVKKLFGIKSPSTVFAEIGVNLIEGLFEGISKTWSKVTGLFEKSIKKLQKFFQDSWRNIKTDTEKIWNDIKDFFTKTWDTIKTNTTKTWNDIKSFLIDKIWNPIKNTAKAVWEGIKKNILDPIEQSWNRLKELWDKIKKYVLDKWNEITQGISNMKNNLINAVMGPFRIVENQIQGVIGNARNWGRNLISNFTEGINSMINGVKNAVSNVANTVKDFLGFSSPTKKGPGAESDKWMPNLMGMLADGIQDNIYEVSAAVSMTAGSIQQSAQPNDMATSIGSAISQSMQGLNNDSGDIQIVVKIGEDTITDKIVDNVNRKNRINGKTVIQV